MAYTKQNFEDGQVLNAEHLNHMEQGIEQLSGEIADLIVKQGGDTLTWDGNTEGLESLGTFFKVSDIVLTKEAFANGATAGRASADSLSFTAEEVQSMCTEDGLCMVGEMALSVPYDGYDFGDGAVLNAGIYFNTSIAGEYVTSLTIPGYTGFGKEVINEKYLPGAVVLYADDASYLYATSDTTDTSKRMRKAHLLEMLYSGRTLLLNLADVGMYLTVVNVLVTADVACATVMLDTGEAFIPMNFYTAEYTG